MICGETKSLRQGRQLTTHAHDVQHPLYQWQLQFMGKDGIDPSKATLQALGHEPDLLCRDTFCVPLHGLVVQEGVIQPTLDQLHGLHGCGEVVVLLHLQTFNVCCIA